MGFLISGIYDVKLLRDNSGTIAAVDVPWGTEVTFEPETEDITWNGDGLTKTITSVTGFGATITADAYSPEVLDSIFGLTEVTASLPTGVTARHYYGSDAVNGGVEAGLEAYCTMIDTDTNAALWGRIVVPSGTLMPPAPPEGLANKSTAQMVMTFSANKTTTDVAGDALPTVPTGGCTWYFEELSAATAGHA